MKVQRKILFHILTEEEQKVGLEKYGNSRNFRGIIFSGTGSTGYKIRFYDLPTDHHVEFVERRYLIEVVDPNEEKKEYDHQGSLEEELPFDESPKKKKTNRKQYFMSA